MRQNHQAPKIRIATRIVEMILTTTVTEDDVVMLGGLHEILPGGAPTQGEHIVKLLLD